MRRESGRPEARPSFTSGPADSTASTRCSPRPRSPRPRAGPALTGSGASLPPPLCSRRPSKRTQTRTRNRRGALPTTQSPLGNAELTDCHRGVTSTPVPTTHSTRSAAVGAKTGEEQLHVVFGTGQVGTALAAHLTGMGLAVRTCHGTGRARWPTVRTGGRLVSPTRKPPRTRPRAHRSCTSASTLLTTSGRNSSATSACTPRHRRKRPRDPLGWGGQPLSVRDDDLDFPERTVAAPRRNPQALMKRRPQ